VTQHELKRDKLAEPVPTTSTEDGTSPTDTQEDAITKQEETDPIAADSAETHPSKKRKAIVEEIEVDITKPEPPSKKALRLLKKGKPLPPSKSGAESPEPKAKETKKPEVEKRSEHGVWIGNLAFHVSKENLISFFSENSDIAEDSITRIHMPGPNDNKSANKVEETRKFAKAVHNKGFAYVDFSSAEDVEKAVGLSEKLLSGRRVLIKNNKSFEGRPEKTKEEVRMEGKPPSTRIFVGNLSFDTTEESLKAHFEKCGSIASVKVASFEDTGKCKGYAWVVFEDIEAAKNAVRGYVYIEEEASDASESEESSEDESDSEKKIKERKPKNVKRRKWWVNQISRRPLRMEFAEDAQVRYTKRYGKDGTKNPNSQNPNARIPGSGLDADKDSSNTDATRTGTTKPFKVVEYRKPYAARLTGGIVESKGKKVTF